MEGAYLSFLWIITQVVGSLVWIQACECVTYSVFHLLKGLLLCGSAHVIGIGLQETHCVGINTLAICIDVEQQTDKDAAWSKVILLSGPSAAFADKVHRKRMFDSMV